MRGQEQFTTPRYWCDFIEPPCPLKQHSSCGVSIYFSRIPDWKKRREQAMELFARLPENRADLLAICERGLYS